jgi:methylmalonyl-CoA/ethylmalonyl-CoA epimerase
VGGIIVLAILISVIRAKPQASTVEQFRKQARLRYVPPPTAEDIHSLADQDPEQRAQFGDRLYSYGASRTLSWFDEWQKNADFQGLLIREKYMLPDGEETSTARLTIGIAVLPETFEKIRMANGSPPLAEAPLDQDVIEFELEFRRETGGHARLDILTTKTLGGNGAIARFLEKFGEGIQQVEIDVADVDRATEILRTRFSLEPLYPATIPGANGTRVNFFLVNSWNGSKVLVELVEAPSNASHGYSTSYEKS